MGARVTRPSARWLALGVVASMAGAIVLELVRETRFPRDTVAEAVLYFPSGRAVKHLGLSYDALLADVYWIRAAQHFGSTRLKKDLAEKKYALLYPLLTIATTLDPQFNVAYRFGAIFLSEAPPGGPGRPDQAIALLQRGLEARPGNWRYMQDIGFVHYWWLRDFRTAAEWFNRGADQPGAPWWLRSLAANTLAQGGDRRASRALWEALAQTPDNEWLQRDARRRLQQLDALDAIADLDARVRRYREAGGAPPFTWEALARAGLLRGTPLDPTGTPYELAPYSGDVALGDSSPLNPLPSEPPRLTPQ